MRVTTASLLGRACTYVDVDVRPVGEIRLGLGLVVPAVVGAGGGLAIGGEDPRVAAAGVKEDLEALRRCSNAEMAKILGLWRRRDAER